VIWLSSPQHTLQGLPRSHRDEGCVTGGNDDPRVQRRTDHSLRERKGPGRYGRGTKKSWISYSADEERGKVELDNQLRALPPGGKMHSHPRHLLDGRQWGDIWRLTPDCRGSRNCHLVKKTKRYKKRLKDIRRRICPAPDPRRKGECCRKKNWFWEPRGAKGRA